VTGPTAKEDRHAHARSPTLLRAGSSAVALGAAALAPPAPPSPCAPSGQAGAACFYRFKLGTIEITVVSDGTLAFPAEMLWGDWAEDARGLLTSTFQPPSPVGLQLNTILVNTGDKLVLIDAGCGVDKFQKTAGGLLGNLGRRGLRAGRYRHDPVHSRPLRPPVGHQ